MKMNPKLALALEYAVVVVLVVAAFVFAGLLINRSVGLQAERNKPPAPVVEEVSTNEVAEVAASNKVEAVEEKKTEEKPESGFKNLGEMEY